MYDYIIVGAGSAGCVLAGRLSEDPDVSVLLLEAGGPDSRQEVQVPAAFTSLFRTPCDWAYETEPQSRLHDRRLFWPRGKLLGGCSSINAMIYVRGNPLDYGQWRELGNEGWSYAEVLPYFKRSQNQARGASEHHGVDGPLHVSDLRSPNPLSHAFVAAGEEVGLPRNPDFNGAEQDGVGFYQVTQKAGRRHSAADAFLRPALRRANLTVWMHAHVARVLFEGTRAVGVEVLRDGRRERVQARAEVILSGGAVNSPQVLMLSGIGPADSLRALGVPVVVDLPGVGANLQDHLVVPVVYDCRRPVSLDGADTVANLARFLVLRQGPLTSNIAEAGAFVRTHVGLPAPDLQFHFGPAYLVDHGFTRRAGHSFSLGPTLLTPWSRGRISLESTDPLEPPRIQPEYLAHPEDLRVLVEGVRLAREMAHTQAFAPYRGDELHPGPDARGDRELEEYIRASVQTLYHPVGTCRMGDDAMAVVDSQLRVRGVDGLRVVDASVMPVIVRGNTNAPTLMISEKAVDLIRGPQRWWFPLDAMEAPLPPA